MPQNPRTNLKVGHYKSRKTQERPASEGGSYKSKRNPRTQAEAYATFPHADFFAAVGGGNAGASCSFSKTGWPASPLLNK